MELSHNQCFQFSNNGMNGPHTSGLYRVIFDEPRMNITVVVLLQPFEPEVKNRGGRNKILNTFIVRKKPPPPLVGGLIWMDRTQLANSFNAQLMHPVEVEREGIYYTPLLTLSHQAIFDSRCRLMKNFLNFKVMKDMILVHHGLGGLVNDVIANENVSRSHVYKLWSMLCRHGMHEISLRPRTDKCGAPGAKRPCDANGRKKAGAKTLKQRIARLEGLSLPPDQPGLSSTWRAAILAADSAIKTKIKPRMPARVIQILSSAFVRKYVLVDNKHVPVSLELGNYPNPKQIIRVLTTEKSKLEILLERTTRNHFKSSLRGLVEKHTVGVAGPNHTWAIDSTVGDIYLRSSVNRSWIVGRPIVYIVVDYWSTAILGFYVCLTGPSWADAKVSIFNACCDPNLIGSIWGYDSLYALNPAPTLCHNLLCDRGEYLSKGAKLAGMRLDLDLSYTPPYRGDLKGLVEVLHRITKDEQFLFTPGAMDARQKAFDLRRSNAQLSVLTVREYSQLLYIIFRDYNASANRRNHVDAHMAAAGVHPSPAGLWHWGHSVGMGYQKATNINDLVAELLPRSTANVGRSGVLFARNNYTSEEVQQKQWTTTARNFGGGWSIPIHYYPGSVSQIWTPNVEGKGFMNLQLSDQSLSSPELTFDEALDAFKFSTLSQPNVIHQKLQQRIHGDKQRKTIIANASQLTAEAISSSFGAMPSMTEARLIENTFPTNQGFTTAKSIVTSPDEAMLCHNKMLHALLQEMTGSQN